MDEFKIGNLQSQLQSEKQQRLMDAIERSVNAKMDDTAKKVDQSTTNYLQMLEKVNTNISNLKDAMIQIKSKQENMFMQQNEIQKAQHQLVNRQNQLFCKQDQIQSTLADEKMHTL